MRDGILFSVEFRENYRARHDPMYRAMNTWNSLPVATRNVESKAKLRKPLKNSLINPYIKVELKSSRFDILICLCTYSYIVYLINVSKSEVDTILMAFQVTFV